MISKIFTTTFKVVHGALIIFMNSMIHWYELIQFIFDLRLNDKDFIAKYSVVDPHLRKLEWLVIRMYLLGAKFEEVPISKLLTQFTGANARIKILNCMFKPIICPFYYFIYAWTPTVEFLGKATSLRRDYGRSSNWLSEWLISWLQGSYNLNSSVMYWHQPPIVYPDKPLYLYDTLTYSTLLWIFNISKNVDKVIFSNECEKLNIPHISNLLVVQGDNIIEDHLGDKTPDFDLFIKPASGFGGLNNPYEAWVYQNDGTWKYEGDGTMTVGDVPNFSDILIFGELVDRMRFISNKGKVNVLMQERIIPHPDIQELIGWSVLVDIRMVTAKQFGRDPEFAYSYMRYPTIKGLQVANLHRGGLDIPIDPETGVCPDDELTKKIAPRVAGFQIPFWKECKELCVRNHKLLFQNTPLTGADIYLSSKGPALIETNQTPADFYTSNIYTSRKKIAEAFISYVKQYGNLTNMHRRKDF